MTKYAVPLVLCVMFGCKTTGKMDGRSAPVADNSRVIFPSSEQIANNVEWAMGQSYRLPPTDIPDGYLVKRGSSVALTGCVPAESIMPGPGGDGEIYITAGDEIFRHKPESSPELLVGDLPSGLRRLLAFKLETSPLEVLAEFWIDEQRELWIIEIADETVHGRRAAMWELPATKEEFFAQYRATRCRDSDQSCLVVTCVYEACHLDMEPTRGQSRLPKESYSNRILLDARWYDDDILLLVRCTDRTHID